MRDGAFHKIRCTGIFNYANAANLDAEYLEWEDKSQYFEDKRDSNKRFPHALMPTDQVSGNMTTISLAHYEEDSKNLPIIMDLFPTIPDSLDWHAIEKPQDLYRIYLNENPVSDNNSKWQKVITGKSGQKAYQFMLDIEQLKPGIHEIRIEKIILFSALGFSEPEIKLKKIGQNFLFSKSHLDASSLHDAEK